MLEHRHRRIRIARIDEAGIVALEARLGRLHRVVEIALGQEQRFRRFLEIGAQGAAMDELGRLARNLMVAGLSGRHLALLSARERVRASDRAIIRKPRSFSPLFSVAASRPAQMTTLSKALAGGSLGVNAAEG